MLTNGWRRYNWNNMLVQRMPFVKYPADSYLSVNGFIGKELMGKLGKDETVNLIIKTADSANYFYSTAPDKNGNLKRTGLIFYDTAMVYYSFNKNKNFNSQLAFGNSNFTNIQPTVIYNYNNSFLSKNENDTSYKSTALFKYYTEHIF